MRGGYLPPKASSLRETPRADTDKPNVGLIGTAPSPIANRKPESDVIPARIAVLGFPGTPDGRQGGAQLLRNFPPTHPV